MKFIITKHLQDLSQQSEAVKKQFYPSKEELSKSNFTSLDHLSEEKYTPTKGLVHKYAKRVLILSSQHCASYCRFCMRKRLTFEEQKSNLTDYEIDDIVNYIKKNKEINEAIFSGGDPLVNPLTLKTLIQKIVLLEQVKIFRIHTRLPIMNPEKINLNLLKEIKNLIQKKPLYMVLHINHPDELTNEVEKVIHQLQNLGVVLLSQSVSLKGVNNNINILENLFNKIVELGVKPYYFHRCDLVSGAEHFIVPLEEEVSLVTELRKRISGLAMPTHVIDTPNGVGKIPIHSNYWLNKNSFKDFDGKIQEIKK